MSSERDSARRSSSVDLNEEKGDIVPEQEFPFPKALNSGRSSQNPAYQEYSAFLNNDLRINTDSDMSLLNDLQRLSPFTKGGFNTPLSNLKIKIPKSSAFPSTFHF